MLRRWLLVLAASTMLVGACVQDDTATTASVGSSTTQPSESTVATTPDMTTAASLVTIMHVGEGVTEGGQNHSTYRCFLDTMLHDAGVTFDFVGSRQNPGYGTDYTCPTDFDQDHEAWGEP